MANNPNQDNGLQPEYDFTKLESRGRGRHAESLQPGTVVSVVLDPDVQQAFPTSEAVNDALRGLMQNNAGVTE